MTAILVVCEHCGDRVRRAEADIWGALFWVHSSGAWGCNPRDVSFPRRDTSHLGATPVRPFVIRYDPAGHVWTVISRSRGLTVRHETTSWRQAITLVQRIITARRTLPLAA